MDRLPNLYEANDYSYPGDPLGTSKEVHFEYVKDLNGNILPKYVKLCGFRGTQGSTTKIDLDFIFTIADNNNNPTEDGTRLILPNDIFWNKNNTVYESCVSTNGKYFLGALYTPDESAIKQLVDLVDMVPYFYRYAYKSGTSAYASWKQDMPYWIGEMSRKADGNIRIEFKTAALFYGTGFSGTSGYNYNYQTIQSYISTNHDKIIDKMTIETYRPSGTSSFNEYSYTFGNAKYGTSGTSKTAKFRVDYNADGSFNLLNPFGNGYAREMGTYASFDPRLWTGRLIDGKLVLIGGQNVDVNHNNALGGNQQRNGRYQTRLAILTGFPNRGVYTYDNIEGTITNTPTIEHRTVHDNNYWVYPGGCKTFLTGMKVDFGDKKIAGVFNEMLYGSDIYHSTNAWGGLKLDFDDLDVTLQGDITGGTMGYDATKLWPQITFSVTANDSYVDSYTLWMIPLTTIANAHPSTGHTDFTHENGHPLGFAVQTLPKSACDTETFPKTYRFDRLFNKSEMSAGQLDPDNKYVFYVQANYHGDTQGAPALKAASRTGGLTGTFHGFYGVGNPTGHSDLSVPGMEAEVSAQSGVITVSNTEAQVAIFTIDGRCVYAGQPAAVEVGNGLFIVKVGNDVRKIAL